MCPKHVAILLYISKMDVASISNVMDMLCSGKTYDQISHELKLLHPDIQRGLSARSIRRYVKENKLKDQVDQVGKDEVASSVNEVSAVYAMPV